MAFIIAIIWATTLSFCYSADKEALGAAAGEGSDDVATFIVDSTFYSAGFASAALVAADLWLFLRFIVDETT